MVCSVTPAASFESPHVRRARSAFVCCALLDLHWSALRYNWSRLESREVSHRATCRSPATAPSTFHVTPVRLWTAGFCRIPTTPRRSRLPAKFSEDGSPSGQLQRAANSRGRTRTIICDQLLPAGDGRAAAVQIRVAFPNPSPCVTRRERGLTRVPRHGGMFGVLDRGSRFRRKEFKHGVELQ